MGLLEFGVLLLLTLFLAWVIVWLAGLLAPGHPPMIDHLVWGLAVLIILFTITRALGVHDVRIPRVFGFVSQSVAATPTINILSSKIVCYTTPLGV